MDQVKVEQSHQEFCVGRLCWHKIFFKDEVLLCVLKFPLKFPSLSPHLQTICELLLTLLDQLPVGLPDVDGFWVSDVVLQGLLIQQVEKVLDSQRYRPTGAEDRSEQIVHKLLKCSLRRSKDRKRSTRCEHKRRRRRRRKRKAGGENNI